MGIVIDLDQRRKKQIDEEKTVSTRLTEAEVLLFTGVRFEYKNKIIAKSGTAKKIKDA